MSKKRDQKADEFRKIVVPYEFYNPSEAHDIEWAYKAGWDAALESEAVRKLVEALDFYAKKKHYYLQAGMGERVSDTGSIARNALAEFEKAKAGK
jgi:hypothetical protein